MVKIIAPAVVFFLAGMSAGSSSPTWMEAIIWMVTVIVPCGLGGLGVATGVASIWLSKRWIALLGIVFGGLAVFLSIRFLIALLSK